jgi:hypothetical protein
MTGWALVVAKIRYIFNHRVMTMKTKIVLGFLLAALFSCMPEPEAVDLVKYMVVQTEYNSDFVNEQENVFEVYDAFTIRMDTIGYVSTFSDEEYLLESDVPGFVIPVVDSVRDAFVGLGFTQVEETENPDFAVNVVVLDNFSYYQSINYGYGYYGSYYGYYGYYQPIVTTYYSNYVTLLIQVVSTTKVNDQFPVLWSAYIGDLNATLDLRGKTLEAIGQAIEQSSYLNRNL